MGEPLKIADLLEFSAIASCNDDDDGRRIIIREHVVLTLRSFVQPTYVYPQSRGVLKLNEIDKAETFLSFCLSRRKFKNRFRQIEEACGDD